MNNIPYCYKNIQDQECTGNKIENKCIECQLIASKQELDHVNNQLDYLLSRGSNDEKLVDLKRTLEKFIRENDIRQLEIEFPR